MTSRKRNNNTASNSDVSRSDRRSASRKSTRTKRRQHLLEKLEARQLLAGPQLIGIQPNEGELIVDGTVRNIAPRSLTFRFDQTQRIDPTTLSGIQISRSGPDGQFDTADDIAITPGSMALGEQADNEVVVRFAESLPDDRYRIDVLGFDDVGRGIVGLKNTAGEFLMPRQGNTPSERVEFDLRLGAQIEAIVPQPVVRLDNGQLQQRRNEIVVYFNEDELFVENDPATGLPTERSAENPRFYQLLLTEETVRTTDDTMYLPERVIYDSGSSTARLIFAGDDINRLPGVPIGGGTFRLRVGTAVDTASDLIIEPTKFDVAPRVTSNLGAASDLEVEFVSDVFSEAQGNRQIVFVDSGAGGLSVSIDPTSGDVVYDFGGASPTVQQLQNVTQSTPAVDNVISVSFSRGGVANGGGGIFLPQSLVGSAPLQMVAAGDTLTTATDVGVLGQAGVPLSSLLISESIDPQPYQIQLPGAPTDPGRAATPGGPNSGLARVINERFGPDVTDGITEIDYNFNGIFSGGAGTGLPAQLNNITEIHKRRVREAISLWSNYLGIQFRETKDSGVTFALGSRGVLLAQAGSDLREVDVLDADVRIDPTFQESALILSNQVSFDLNYGEDFFRKVMAGIGLLLGLEQNDEVTAQTLMALDPAFLNATINPDGFVAPVDPFIPSVTTFQQTINPDIDSQVIADPVPNSLEGPEPVFPGNQDILHGRLLHRPDSIDVDLFRFEVALQAGREFGTLTVESFAERLADSSLLDTSLTLFQDTSASATTNFGLGTEVSVDIHSQLPGNQGNRSRIEFIRTDRSVGDTAIRVERVLGDNGVPISNVIRVDLPRLDSGAVTVGQVLDAINGNAFASTLFELELTTGNRNTPVNVAELESFSPVVLSGGGTVALTQNDDYFSNDSLLTAQLSNGIYYIGVAASGNEDYDPSLAESGFGGRTQGEYELLLKFEPQVSQTDIIRDRDSQRTGVPGTAIDGDLDGTPGGAKNFWFQTRSLERSLQVRSNGSGIVPGQTLTVTSAAGVTRRFEFVPIGSTPSPGNLPVFFQPASSQGNLAVNLATAINGDRAVLNVIARAEVDATTSPETAQVILSGERSLSFSNNFQGIEALGRTIFVDKLSSVVADGSLSQPFNNIASTIQASAFGSALPGDIVRIIGNGGQDNNIATPADNFAYQIGVSELGGNNLPDGRQLNVPKGVTTMIDAGAAFKLRSSFIGVGSDNLLSDRSGGALQVLGAPKLLKLTDPSPVGAAVRDVGIETLGDDGNVVFTSTRDRSVDSASSGNSPAPADGNWGGLIFRRDFDRSQGRFSLEEEGVFLQVVNHADIRFGGGSNILINSVQQTVNPIQMIDSRPTVTFNRLTNNASAAMSATPDAFLETRFQAPRFQQAGAFTADYSRIGPDIKRNLVVGNSINGLFIRTENTGTQEPRKITVATHIDDVDIVHYIAENVVISGQPGGPIRDGFQPDASSVSLQTVGGGSLDIAEYRYRVTFVDAAGFESLASDPTDPVMTSASARQVQLLNLPIISSNSDYLSRRLYRLDPADGMYRLVGQLNRSDSTFTDDGVPSGGAVLDLTREGVRGRLDGSLVIDPDTVVKFRGARIELDHGTQLLAEGLPGQPVIFTSALDDRFGAGGSFDTNEDEGTAGGGTLPQRGDWSGIYAGPGANVSFDNAVVAYGGGVSLIEGGQTRGFAPLELQQASGRITNSRFEYNDNAQDGSGPVGRNGRLAVTPATIYGRFTQPIIAGNQFVDNYGAIIDLDLASMTDELITDVGRQTGDIDLLVGLNDNHGPLIRRNMTDSIAGDVDGLRQMNGLRIRGGELTSGSVWDDTDIAHVLYSSVVVGNQVSGGALTLQSRPDESLVIKLAGRGTPNSATAGTGITATGSTGNIDDRIGGTVHVLGLPGSPVVFTSLKDDTVGAGRRIDGTAESDTNGDGFGSRPQANDWRSLYLDGNSNDRNVAVVVEQELSTAAPPGLNSNVTNAQILGDLAENLIAGDDQLRLGFEVNGFISGPGDVDSYAFTAAGGTQVWIDMDRTSLGLDTLVELVDDSGRVLARSDNSFDEIENPASIDVLDPDLLAGSLGDRDNPLTERWATGSYYDVGSTNLRDAGFRITLPGGIGTRSDYFVRVRASSADPGDKLGGLTDGAYRVQVRLQEAQEFPGSVVRYADIRFANHGIHVQGLPGSSPLLGEAQENEAADPFSGGAGFNPFLLAGGLVIDGEPRYPTDLYASNDDINGGFFAPFDPFGQQAPLAARPQYLGDLVDSKTGTISVGGQLMDISDIDFYQLDVDAAGSLTNIQQPTTFDIDYAAGFDRPDTNLSVFYSPSGNPNQSRLVLFGENSNVLDDLSSPLDSDLVGELLQRGSISESDPLIGPVALPAGSYFIAVTESGRAPLELTSNSRVRRAPLDSVVRIFDDHVEAVGGSTAGAPVEGQFVATTSAGWAVTLDRSTDRGHQRTGSLESMVGNRAVGTGGATTNDSAVGTDATIDPPDLFDPSNPPEDPNDSFSPPGPSTSFTEDTIILEFEPQITQATRSALLQQEGFSIVKEFQSIDAIVVNTPPQTDILREVERLSEMPEIRYAEPDYTRSLDATPNDPLYAGQWHYNNIGQTGGTAGADIDAQLGWDTFTGSPQTVIAVVDAGIDLNHPDLIDNLWVNPGEIAGDGIDNDGNGYIDDINGIDPFDGDTIPQDTDGHGTHVSGTTGASGNNGIGVTGVNWNSKIMALRGCGVVVCSTAATIESIDYFTVMKNNFGVNVVVSNHSYGGGGFSIAERSAIQASINAGVPFVTSSGNDGLNSDFFPHFPSGYNLDGIIAVGATDDNDVLAGFSNRGAASVDLSAPGVDVLSTTLGGGYGLLSGTSMASPHVAGAVALLAGFEPNATVAELKEAILMGADPMANQFGTSVTGARLNLAGAFAFLTAGGMDNESFRFDRSEDVGTLTANPFDLAGYSAADLPRFYFDYFIDAAPGETITVSARSVEQPTSVELDIDLSDTSLHGTWRQAVIPLEQYAGDTGIVIDFVYDADTSNTTAEGLYLDNFIVGFAERGELISNALTGSAAFSTTSTGTPGHYQLEVRPATRYSEPIAGGVLVERALESAPNLIDPVFLSFPAGRAIARYETFSVEVLNETSGVNETLVFQFQPTETNLQDSSLVDPTAIPVPYSQTDSQPQVVRSVVTAITAQTEYAFFAVRATDVQLTQAFDTNDRHDEQVTLIAPSGDQIADGDTLTLGDGSQTVRFEFNSAGSVTFGNIGIPFSTSDTATMVARHLIEVINSPVVQGNLKLRASTPSGEWDFNNPISPETPPTDARVAIHGPAVGNFNAVESAADATPTGTALPVAADGSVMLSAIFHEGKGDRNTLRTQGQVIVENNQITEVRAIGIWSDPGKRGVDPEDIRDPSVVPAPTGNFYLQQPPVGNSPLGAVLNLPTLNDSVDGGLAPGLVAQNNIIDRAGYTGIKVDGETRPFVIEWNGNGATYASGGTLLNSRADIQVPDGYIMAIDAGGTRVVFEFEDISGAPVPLGGSGVAGGDGWVDGHVPIYYRLGQGATYNPSDPAPVRNTGYSGHELMMAIYESIQGSILVTNGLVELVRPTLGPSVTSPFGPNFRAEGEDPIPFRFGGQFLDFVNPAIYLEGVTGIYSAPSFQKSTQLAQLNIGLFSQFFSSSFFNQQTGETANGPAPEAPIYEAPQPLAKIINNTVRGSDGTEGAILIDGSLSPAVEIPTNEPNDTITNAIDTKLEVSHRGGYFADGVLGDNVGLLPSSQDVDFYQVELSVGDRLVVDMNTSAGGPASALRLFDSSGTEVAVGENGALPDYLKPGSTVEFPVVDDVNARDSMLDFTALKTDTYYVGVSSVGNEAYEVRNLSARTDGSGGTGDYNIGIEVLAPRSFTFSLDSHPLTPFDAEVTSGTINGTTADGGPAGARSLVGTTFTISQIPDYLIPTRPGDAYAGVNADGNRVTFEYTNGVNQIVLGNGNINIPILQDASIGINGGHRVPDIMRATANAINGYLNNPALPNHEVGNGPDGREGPITRVSADALGGNYGDNTGIFNYIREFGPPFNPIHGGFDFTTGFGHDRRESGDDLNIVPDGTFTDSQGAAEIYVLIENAAKVELSPEARAAGLKLGPDNSRLANGDLRNPEFATESDQLLVENGILVGSGVSAAILNNVVVNAHQSIVKEESSVFGFGGRIDELNQDLSVKKGQVVASGNAFQYDEERNTQMRSDLSWWVVLGINVINRNPALDTSLSTDLRTGPSNISGGDSDFNFVVRQPGTPGQTPGNFITLIGDDLLEDAAAGRFSPAANAAIIDSAVDSIQSNVDLATLNELVGIPNRPILAPARDQSGQLRADEPNMAPPGGIGANVFKDRGALDLADFVGPIVTLDAPLDNDFAGSDSDPASSFVRRTDGGFTEFRILVQDLGDDSDPFVGTGIDDDSVVVSPIEGLRNPGSNVALFENDRLLEEGIDYTFSYDESRGVITLTPLAGVWRDDRAYRIQLNNRDRTVLVAPDPNVVGDGSQISIVDSSGGRLVFEFESGYSLRVPEAVTLVVPQAGTNAGGLSDGDIFQINDGSNSIAIFEFNGGDATLPGTTPIELPQRSTPTTPAELQVFLNEIADSIANAIQSVVDSGDLNVDVRVIDNQVVIGGNAGTRTTTSSSGLQQLSRTLALHVPGAGTGFGGIVDGDTFSVDNGTRTVTFEFDSGNGLTNGANVPVDISGSPTAADIAVAIRDNVANANLGLNPSIAANNVSVYLNLPVDGSARVLRGQLSVVGLSRPAADGDLIVISPNDGSPDVTLEINRTDGPGNGPTSPNIPLDITRGTTANDLAGLITNVLRNINPEIAGLDEDGIRQIATGVSVGGDQGLGFVTTGTSLEVTGSPSVTGASTIQVFGPLLINFPLVGGGGILDGSVLVLTDDAGNDVIFEFNVTGSTTSVNNSIAVPYDSFSTVDVVVDNLVAAINGAGVGITAANVGVGQMSLGRIDQSRVNISGIPSMSVPGLAGATLRRGIVSDGEVLTIRQGSVVVNYEFDSAIGGGGVSGTNVPVVFQLNSTSGDVAASLAAAINNNKGGLNVQAVAEVDANGVPTGEVLLNDQPGTSVDVSAAPTLNVLGVPGGATPIRISPEFSAEDVKKAMLAAINSISGVTDLVATDRGGATFFVENGQLFEGPIQSYFLPGIKDRAGNMLEPNRDDNTSQFTILLPTIGLDFGDAPDPRGFIPGRLPTLLSSDGARHVITPGLMLGSRVDAEPDAQMTPGADGDDLVISISTPPAGSIFDTSIGDGFAEIRLQGGIDATSRDGDTVTLTLGGRTVTLELDTDGIFEEANFAIAPVDPSSSASIAEAIQRAINESGLAPSEVDVQSDGVLVFSDDEDGVSFISDVNPNGNFSKSVQTPISVTVTGGGVVEAWIDLNADGDWNDPGEQIISATTPGAIFAESSVPQTAVFNVTVPEFASPPPTPTTTYARFRVSRDGGLTPQGLALSGEVEDYAVRLLPGSAPTIVQPATYVVEEDGALQALDTGGLTATTNDDSLLRGVVDPDGDPVAIVGRDTGTRTLFAQDGTTFAGELQLASDGTFSFIPEDDFNGITVFTVSVTDVQALNPENELVASQPLTVTISVTSVNDPPTALDNDVIINRTTPEDVPITFLVNNSTDGEGLIEGKYQAGPSDELSQPLIIQSAFSSTGPFLTTLGGSLVVSDAGDSLLYTPPADYNGTVPDTFNYVVADVPGGDLLSETADKLGTVSISFTAVNDPPRTTDDEYVTQESQPLTIPIFGTTAVPGILDDDVAGPEDELMAPENQTLSLQAGQFPKTTLQGGTVELVGDDLIYTPRDLFSGNDVFEYVVVDSANPPLSATGRVTVRVGGVNNGPRFIGINGDINQNSITRDEAKVQAEQVAFDLTTWFADPEDDDLVFTASSRDSTIVSTVLNNDTLILTFPPFAFTDPGQPVVLDITATDTVGETAAIEIPVTVNNTPDPPTVIQSISRLDGTEDQLVTADLTQIFEDPDGEQLDYFVARIGNITNPSAEQIAQHPVINTIGFSGNTLVIQLKPDQFGTAELEIAATDGSFVVSDSFLLDISAAPDSPVAQDDNYNVPIGGTLQIVNPANGLLGNDSDADNETIVIDSNTMTNFGTLTVNADGTFTYVNEGGTVGDVDTFTYQVRDVPGGAVSNEGTVSLRLNQSRYQNPIGGLESDVNADGVISAIDALRVINFLNRVGNFNLPVSQIPDPPPDYYDTNGNGFVQPSDALAVIRDLSKNSSLSGELVGEGESAGNRAAAAVTTSFAAGSPVGLPVQSFEATTSAEDPSDPRDQLLTSGLEVVSPSIEKVVQAVASPAETGGTSESVDEALSLLLDDLSLDGEMDNT